MKKSLIALALMGAFSGAAFAQSNVTLYGILDVNLQRNDPKEGTCFSNFSGGTVTNCSATTGLNGGHQSGNRIGVRGTEALGGGMSAIFTLEQGFSIDTGDASSTRAFHRQAWAGLQFDNAKLAVVGGRLATFSSGTGSFDLWGFVDPFLTGFGDSSLGSTFTSSAAARADNVIAIVGGPWAGFKGGLGYSFNLAGGESAGSSNNNRAIITGAQYAWGPLQVALTYDVIQPANPALDDEKHLQLGGTWDFKIAKLHAAYAKEDNVYFNTPGGTSVTLNAIDPGADADAWMVGVTVPLMGGSLLGSYQDRDGDPVAISPTVTRERDLAVWALGYTYPLSRRTNWYVSFSSKDGKKDANGVASIDRNQATLGIRHLF